MIFAQNGDLGDDVRQGRQRIVMSSEPFLLLSAARLGDFSFHAERASGQCLQIVLAPQRKQLPNVYDESLSVHREFRIWWLMSKWRFWEEQPPLLAQELLQLEKNIWKNRAAHRKHWIPLISRLQSFTSSASMLISKEEKFGNVCEILMFALVNSSARQSETCRGFMSGFPSFPGMFPVFGRGNQSEVGQ